MDRFSYRTSIVGIVIPTLGGKKKERKHVHQTGKSVSQCQDHIAQEVHIPKYAETRSLYQVSSSCYCYCIYRGTRTRPKNKENTLIYTKQALGYSNYLSNLLRIFTKICSFSSSVAFSKLSRSWRRCAGVSTLTSTCFLLPVAGLKKTEVRTRL